ncbi:MAG TPA: phospholipase D-like domain-containing protein, partial [Kofleriaceae bacterium]
ERVGTPTISFKRRDELVRAVSGLEARPAPRDFQPTRCRFFQSRPRLRESYIQQAYMKLLAGAKQEVLIENAYFVPTIATRIAIEKTARHCVRVVILTNGVETNDTPGMSLLGRGYYSELLAVNAELAHCPNRDAGVEIWEWHGREPGSDRQTQGLLHSKFAVVDRQLALVGSYNLDPRSERLNSESAIVFESDALAGQLRTLVERDLATARRITAAEAATFEKPATIMQRFKKDLAGLFEDHY